jgi:hypothetical protein
MTIEDLATEAENCSKQGNAYPYCLPLTTETWTNGSTHDFIWNFK